MTENFQVEWLADLGRAAEELGYLIVEIGARHIELVPKDSHLLEGVQITGVMISGQLLRDVLKPRTWS